jgi:hypothetical protein
MSEQTSDKKGEATTKEEPKKVEESKKKLTVPFGELTELPSDYKTLDDIILDQILQVAGLGDISPLKDSTEKFAVSCDWKSIGQKNGIDQFYGAMPGSSNHLFKGVGIVPAPPKLLEDAIRVQENMKLIDPMCKEVKCIKTFDKDHHIYYANFKVGPMLSDRDFVWWCIDANLQDGTYISTGKSMLTKDCPDVPKRVRGEIRASGYVVQPVKDDPKSSRVTYVVQTDPRGWLPTWIVNIVAASQAYNPGIMKEKVPMFLETFEKEAKERADKEKAGKDDKKDPKDDKPKTDAPATSV